jgi:Protein of unknown function (DUF2809)
MRALRCSLPVVYLCLALAVIAAGLGLRLVPVGLPAAVVKWGGSVLWAWMVYCLVAALLWRRGPLAIGSVAILIATAVELSRLYRAPGLDAFRLTMAGKLLLGKVFEPWHFVVYAAAIAAAALADGWWIRPLCAAGRGCDNR